MIYFIGQKVNHIGVENATIKDLIEYFKHKDEIGFDTETTGFDPYIDKLISYQLGNGVHQFVVDASIHPIEEVKDILLNKELLIHNAKFDLKFLYHVGIYPEKIWDTYLGECVLSKGDKTVRKSLEAVVKKYFNYSLTKTTRGKIFREGFSYKVINYCAEDVQYLPDLKASQWRRLNDNNLLNSINLENLFVQALTYIEYSGIKLDVNLWKQKILQNQLIYQQSLYSLNQWIIDNNITRYIESQLDLFNSEKRLSINWSSPLQVAELFTYLGLNIQVNDEKTGELKDSVDSGVLEKVKDNHPIVPLYLNYKKNETILAKYGETVLTKVHPVTNRIHTSFTQIMDTGRMSSGGKQGDKDTINLQNIPRLPEVREKDKIYERDCFVPEPGNIFIDADYSGQEQIVFANWTLDPDILLFYQNGLGDMHSYIASKIYPYLNDVPLKEIKAKYKRERQIAKSAGFAINYGGDGSTISDNLNIPKEEGQAIYEAYFKAFPDVNKYFKQTIKQALRDGYILFNNISHSKCFIHNFDIYKNLEGKVNHPGFWEKYREEKAKESILFSNELKPLVSKYFKLQGNISRMALNYPIQGSSAEITKLACIYIFKYIKENNLLNIVKFVNVIHDEILLECPENLGERLKEVVENCMAKAGKVYCKVIPLKAEAVICKFWNH